MHIHLSSLSQRYFAVSTSPHPLATYSTSVHFNATPTTTIELTAAWLSTFYCCVGNGEFCITNLPVTPTLAANSYLPSMSLCVPTRAIFLLLLPLLEGRVVFASSHPSHYVRIRTVYYFAHSSSHPYTSCVVVVLLFVLCQLNRLRLLLYSVMFTAFTARFTPLNARYSYSSESDALVNASSLKALNFLFPGYNVHIFEDIFRK